ncbi:MAG: DDE-type integrase/transposase/recombinase [Gammaproteobacteria bacterium]|nr:DDE-type integrase/transposase/recombinase [Gammaproteobacteria bacterium]
MNNQYHSVQELSGLPGLPTTPQNINVKAKKENWLSRPRKGKGGGKEYHIDSLPVETQNHFAQLAAEAQLTKAKKSANKQATEFARTLAVKNSIKLTITTKRRAKITEQIAGLSGSKKARAESKILLLSMRSEFVKNSKLCKTKATQEFLALWSSGQLNIPDDYIWIKDHINENLHPTTLNNWEKKPENIIDKHGHRKGSSKIDRQKILREFITAAIYEYPHIYISQLFEAIESRFKCTETDVPSKRSLERWVKSYKTENAQLFSAITNPDKWKNKYMPAQGTVGVAALNEKWELDSTPADIMLTDGRYNLIGAIDVYSRRVKLLVSKSSTAASVSKLMRDCLLEWGVPEIVKTDNGADYVSVQMKTAFYSLGIEQNISAPFSPWEKPHIERFFRTFSHGLLEIMPGFIGHNVAERSVIEDRKQFSERLFKKGSVIDIDMSSQDLQKFVDEWIDNIYMHNSHTGDGINGKTPFQMVSEWTAPISMIQNERALDILLAEVGERTIGKEGIRLDGFTYIAPELGHMTTERVNIRKDPVDIGTIHVFQNGKFICIAEDTRFVGIKRQEIARQAKQNALKNIAQAKKEIRGMKSRQKVKGLAEEILESKRQVNNITMLPKSTTVYTNDNLEAAAQAASLQSNNIAQSKPLRTAVTHVVTDPQETHRKFLRIEQKMVTGQSVSEQDQRFYNAYENTPEYTNMKEFFEDFGLGLETSSL